MIPVLIGIGGAKVISDFWSADKYESQALNVNYEAFTMVETASRRLRSQYEKLEGTMTKLANRKRGIMSGSLPKFIEVHEKIIQINLETLPSVDVKNLALRPENLREMNQMISVSGIQMSDKEIVSTFLFSIEYGVLLGGILGGISGAIKKDAKIKLDIANTRGDEADTIAYNIDNARVALEGIESKAESVLKLITTMNALFLKSIRYTSEIINRNGFNVEDYSNADIDAIMNCCNFAKGISDILKAPLFDDNGKLHKQINETLRVGNEYVQKMQTVLGGK